MTSRRQAVQVPDLSWVRSRLQVGASSYAVAIGGVTVFALLVRVIALGHQPLGGDESFTALVSRRDWLDMYAAVRSDSGAPLSYALTHLMSSVSGDAAMLRLPAALAGTAAVPLVAALARRIGGDRAGMWAALASAVVPALVLPARDARMYALSGTLVLMLTLTLWRGVERPSQRRLLTHALVFAAAVLCDYFALFAALASLLAAVAAFRPSRQVALRVATATVLGCAALLVWLPFATAQVHHAQQPFWLDGIDFAGAVRGVLSGFFGGPPIDPRLPQHATLVALQGVGIAGVAIAALALLLPIGRPPWVRARSSLGYVLGCGLGATLLIGLVSIARPVLDARYVSVVWTPLFALLGVGLARLRWRASLAVVCMAIATLSMSVVITRADIGSLVRDRLDGHVGSGVLVLAVPDTYIEVLATADSDVVARTHIATPMPPWYFGVAAYPRGAVIDALPPGTRVVDVITQSGDSQPRLVDHAVMLTRSCTALACFTAYAVAPLAIGAVARVSSGDPR